MSKEKKKKKAKEAIKILTSNSFVLSKLRDIFDMQDYSDKEVKKVFKASIKTFLNNNDVDPEQNFWRKAFKDNEESIFDDDEEEENETNNIVVDGDKVKKVSKNKEILSKYKKFLK